MINSVVVGLGTLWRNVGTWHIKCSLLCLQTLTATRIIYGWDVAFSQRDIPSTAFICLDIIVHSNPGPSTRDYIRILDFRMFIWIVPCKTTLVPIFQIFYFIFVIISILIFTKEIEFHATHFFCTTLLYSFKLSLILGYVLLLQLAYVIHHVTIARNQNIYTVKFLETIHAEMRSRMLQKLFECINNNCLLDD
jgi:hypothetical protein